MPLHSGPTTSVFRHATPAPFNCPSARCPCPPHCPAAGTAFLPAVAGAVQWRGRRACQRGHCLAAGGCDAERPALAGMGRVRGLLDLPVRRAGAARTTPQAAGRLCRGRHGGGLLRCLERLLGPARGPAERAVDGAGGGDADRCHRVRHPAGDAAGGGRRGGGWFSARGGDGRAAGRLLLRRCRLGLAADQSGLASRRPGCPAPGGPCSAAAHDGHEPGPAGRAARTAPRPALAP